jgi:hypothetical protein
MHDLNHVPTWLAGGRQRNASGPTGSDCGGCSTALAILVTSPADIKPFHRRQLMRYPYPKLPNRDLPKYLFGQPSLLSAGERRNHRNRNSWRTERCENQPYGS